MDKKRKNFQLDIAILFTFIIAVSSCIVLLTGDPDFNVWGLRRSIWIWIHAGAGLALLTGLIVHIAWHWKQVKASFFKSMKQVRQNRAITIGLLFSFVLTIFSGLFIWSTGPRPAESSPFAHSLASHFAHHIHQFSALLMFVLVVIHLTTHRK